MRQLLSIHFIQKLCKLLPATLLENNTDREEILDEKYFNFVGNRMYV